MFLDQESVLETVREITAVYSKNYRKVRDMFEDKLWHASLLKRALHVLPLCFIGLNFHPDGTNVLY
jgi:hypothetical protein